MASELQKIAFPEKYGPPSNGGKSEVRDKSPVITSSRPADKSRSKVTQLYSVSDVNAEREGKAYEQPQSLNGTKSEYRAFVEKIGNADAAYDALIVALARIEDLAEGASIPVRHRIAEELAEFGEDIELLFARRAYVDVQVLLVVLEKAIYNLVFPF
jgi:hypothetical protein